METVEVVIKVPKDLYEGIEFRNGELETEYVCDELMKAVDNGTVLPKGHDNLIDKGQLLRNVRKKAHEYAEPWKTNLGSVVEYFVAGCDVIIGEDLSNEAPTIIEANKDGE